MLKTAAHEQRAKSGPGRELVLYYRQSLGEDKQQSVGAQKMVVRPLAHNLGFTDEEFENAKVYQDVNRSGADFEGREDFARMLAAANAKQTILCSNQDRLGRDMLDVSVAIRDLVNYKRVSLYTAETGTNPVTMDNVNDTMMVMVRGAGGQSYLENSRKNTRRGLFHRMEQGYATGRVYFGFRVRLENPNVVNRKDSKKIIELHPENAWIIWAIYVLYLDHKKGPKHIARRLNSWRAPSPRGTGWEHTTIKDILRNPAYKGLWSYGRQRTVARVGDKAVYELTPANKVVWQERPHLAIIPPDVWERVQAQVDARKGDLPPQLVAARGRAMHPLSGILKCDTCGCPMRIKNVSNSRGWKRRYYVCTNHFRNQGCPVKVHVPAEEAEAKVTDYLASTVVPQLADLTREQIRKEAREILEQADARRTEADSLRAELEQLTRQTQRLVTMAAATDDPMPPVLAALRENERRSKELKAEIEAATRPVLGAEELEQLEAAAVGELERIREWLGGDEARKAVECLLPQGLRFKIGNGLWLIDGAASVSSGNHTARQHPPPPTHMSRNATYRQLATKSC